MAPNNWYVMTRTGERGPFTARRIRRFAENGLIQRRTLLRKSGMPDPVPARRVQGLFADQAETTVSVTQPRDGLFSMQQVMAATILGSCLAGAGLLALNLKRLGRKSAATMTMVGGVMGAGALLCLVMATYESVPGVAFMALQLCVMYCAACGQQGRILDRFKRCGGRQGSGWAVAGVVATAVVVVFALSFGLAAATYDSPGPI